ncbi:MAG: hypothetical protein V1734_02330 [Nanoarchaeota archaeon]
MIEFHYNIPERSLDSVINSIALHWRPVLSTPEGKIAESILKKQREALLDETRSVKTVKMDWYNATLAGVGIGAYPCNEFTREEHSELTELRYAPPSKTVTDYYIMIYGRQAAGIGDYPLTLGIKDNDSRVYGGNAELRTFAGMAKDMGFKEATEWLYELQDKGLYRNKFEPPITEDILNKKMKQDEYLTYDSLFFAEIQMVRFYWDFFGLAMKNAGYMPEKVNAKTFMFIQPVVKKEIERIAGFPARNAWEVASGMIREAVWHDNTIVQKALEFRKTIMMK